MAPDTRSSKNVYARVNAELENLTKDLTLFLKWVRMDLLLVVVLRIPCAGHLFEFERRCSRRKCEKNEDYRIFTDLIL